MKRYIKGSFFGPDEVMYDNWKAIATEVLEQHNCKMRFHDLGHGSPGGWLTSFDGDSNVLDDGYPTVEGYVGSFDHYFFPAYLGYRNDEDAIAKIISEGIVGYLEDFETKYNELVEIVERIPEGKSRAQTLCEELSQYFRSKYSNVQVTSVMDTYVERVDGYVIDFNLSYYDGLQPNFVFNIVLDNFTTKVRCSFDELTEGDAYYKVISAVNEKLRHTSLGEFNNKLIVSLLKQAGIDTTKHNYELRAERYERYTGGPYYTKKFTCPGDWLAYTSMTIHSQPTASKLDDYFGLAEFEKLIKECPTIEDMHEHAESLWWGDGDDYILYLKNLDTNQVLYQGKEEVEDTYEEDEWND